MSLVAAEKLRLWRDRPDIFVREVFNVIPDPWQDSILKIFPSKQRIAMQACRGPGKLQCKSTLIDTPDGPRWFGDLQVGNFIFAEDGSPTEVLGVYEQGIVKQYKVTFDDGSFTFCGGDHLWKVKGRTERRKNLGWSVIDTNEIIRRGVTVKNGRWAQKQFIIPIQGAAQFSHKNLSIDPYVFGIWLGDGSKGHPSYCKPYVEVEHEINRRGYRTNRAPDGKQVRIYDSTEQFKKIDGYELGSHERFIPDIYKYASVEQRKDLLCGLMDADGNIGKDAHMEFSSTSEKLANDIVWLVRSLGGISLIKDTIKEGKYKDENGEYVICKDCYRVTVTLPFNPFRISHKAERWHYPKERYLTRYISSIEEAHEEDSMCIEVSHPSACYLTNDFIVTHNTCLLAWLAWNFLLTRPHPRIAATSITGDNLADGFWAESAKWMEKSPLLKATFTWQKTRIFSNEHPATWWMSARQWSKASSAEEQGRALSGLHEDFVMFILDESGGMPDTIMQEAEAAMSSCIEGHIIQAGNPVALEGPLYNAATSDRKRWHVVEITGDPDDPNRSPRVHLDWAREQIEKYGRDNPYVRVSVFGKFPESSINALIGPDEVRDAMKRYYRPQEYDQAAKTLGVDVAREGLDSSCIFPVQGLQAFAPLTFRNIDGTEGANHTARKWKEWGADACFVDNTGGFGSSWVDNLVRLGFAPIPVHFNQKSSNPRYYNKRTEMAMECIDWVKRGGALPDLPRLASAMTKTTYTHKGDQLIIEPKELIKVKLGHSPDEFDALMLNWASPVQKASNRPMNTGFSRHTSDYNPLSLDYLRGER